MFRVSKAITVAAILTATIPSLGLAQGVIQAQGSVQSSGNAQYPDLLIGSNGIAYHCKSAARGASGQLTRTCIKAPSAQTTRNTNIAVGGVVGTIAIGILSGALGGVSGSSSGNNNSSPESGGSTSNVSAVPVGQTPIGGEAPGGGSSSSTAGS